MEADSGTALRAVNDGSGVTGANRFTSLANFTNFNSVTSVTSVTNIALVANVALRFVRRRLRVGHEIVLLKNSLLVIFQTLDVGMQLILNQLLVLPLTQLRKHTRVQKRRAARDRTVATIGRNPLIVLVSELLDLVITQHETPIRELNRPAAATRRHRALVTTSQDEDGAHAVRAAHASALGARVDRLVVDIVETIRTNASDGLSSVVVGFFFVKIGRLGVCFVTVVRLVARGERVHIVVKPELGCGCGIRIEV